MRKLLALALLANIALKLASLAVLPDQVAVHFGADGTPNSWSGKFGFMAIMIVLDLMLFALFFFMPALVFRLPPRLINMPNKEYWLSEENMHETRAKFESLMPEYGIATFAFMFCVMLATIMANLADPVRLDLRQGIPIAAGFIAYTIYWCVKMSRAFRLPPADAT